MLESAAAWLATRFQTHELGDGIDCRGALIVVPGRRFGRELMAELVGIGEKTEFWVSPGRVATPGELCGALLLESTQTAPSLVRAMAWGIALRKLRAEEFEGLHRRRPLDDAIGEWVRLGAMLDSTAGELARELILPGEVPQRCRALEQTGDSKRWEIIERCRHTYESLLSERRLTDSNLANLAKLRAADCEITPTVREIVLVGLAELDAASRAAIKRSRAVVSALVFGPESENRWLDEDGCVRRDISRERISIPRSMVEIADDTKASADRAIGRIAAWSEQHRGLTPRDVSVCAPEPSWARDLALAARGVDGLRFHDASGEEIGRASVVKLLVAAGEHLREGTLESLAAIVKRPEVERWIVRRRQPSQNWVAKVDAAAILNPGAPASSLQEDLQQVADAVEELLGPLCAEDRAERETDLILDEIIGFVDRALGGEDQSDREAEALEAIADSIAQVRIAAGMIGAMPAWRWIELLLESIRAARIAAASSRDEIEVLGWLEAAVDRAPFVVVVGFNEGAIPLGRVEDPLLPDRVRAELGMATGGSRAERDAFLLEGLIRSREHKAKTRAGVWFICAKRDNEGNPLKPSRMLFRCEDGEAIDRIERMTSGIPEAARFLAKKHGGAENEDRMPGVGFPVAPLHEIALPSAVRATAFKEYIRSPYVFFLKHVARLVEVDEPDAESDSGTMGTLLHRILKDFGSGEAKSERREAAIAEWVLSQFERAIAELPLQKSSGVRDIQLEVARRRLRTFARVQASHASDGWEIHATEWEAPKPIEIQAPSGTILLKARLDRVDRREKEWLVLDYKTGDTAKEPGKVHLKSKKWIDLQLPLYVYLLRASGLAPNGARAGYFLLPKKSDDGRVEFADWNKDQYAEAEALAAEIVERVLRKRFEQGDDPFEEGAIARLCGVTLLEADPEEVEE
ncbi:MAG: PD-(D/E)XK nuclease family protein [Phycisphaeraceae bacterium]|nr:PD-(D/E)XK nuclease family protein [Phycisphaeraceae bacterium]